jgi:hypothetical protein
METDRWLAVAAVRPAGVEASPLGPPWRRDNQARRRTTEIYVQVAREQMDEELLANALKPLA